MSANLSSFCNELTRLDKEATEIFEILTKDENFLQSTNELNEKLIEFINSEDFRLLKSLKDCLNKYESIEKELADLENVKDLSITEYDNKVGTDVERKKFFLNNLAKEDIDAESIGLAYGRLEDLTPVIKERIKPFQGSLNIICNQVNSCVEKLNKNERFTNETWRKLYELLSKYTKIQYFTNWVTKDKQVSEKIKKLTNVKDSFFKPVATKTGNSDAGGVSELEQESKLGTSRLGSSRGSE